MFERTVNKFVFEHAEFIIVVLPLVLMAFKKVFFKHFMELRVK